MIFYFVGTENSLNYLIYIIILILILISILSKFAKKYYNHISKKYKIILNLFLLLLLFYLNNFKPSPFYILVYFAKILIEYISELSSNIKSK